MWLHICVLIAEYIANIYLKILFLNINFHLNITCDSFLNFKFMAFL